MLHRILTFIEQKKLPKPPAHIIVAISGGADSVVLLHTLLRLGYRCMAAHCNFHLRGEESMRDEKFVADLCKNLKIPFYKIDFNTENFAKENGLSIEMAARKLRYNWFEQLRQEQNADAIAIGQHIDDAIETFFMNLTRGTGIQGLTGIKPQNGHVFRPLLCVTRKEIELFAKNEKLHYITDSTNHKNLYTRNKFRNTILPLFREINPSFNETMLNNISFLRETALLAQLKLDELKSELSQPSPKGVGESFGINLEKMAAYPANAAILHELLSPFNFNSSTIQDISKSLSSISGKTFYSPTHRAIKDREKLLIVPIIEKEENHFFIEKNQTITTSPLALKIEKNSSREIIKDKRFAQINADFLSFPLMVRRWKRGDAFYPFGMKQKKKLSDFFIDNKFSLADKENVWLLTSNEKIVWIIGERLDNRFRVRNNTKNILKIEFAPR